MTWDPPPTRTTGYKVNASDDYNKIVNSLAHLEQMALVGVTSSVLVDVTSVATSTLLVSAGSVTYTTDLHVLFFECAGVQRSETGTSGPSTFWGLYDGGAGTPVVRLGQATAPSTNGLTVPISRRYYFFPSSAGSHTYQIRAYNNSADAFTYLAGAAGGDVFMPMTISIYRVAV